MNFIINLILLSLIVTTNYYLINVNIWIDNLDNKNKIIFSLITLFEAVFIIWIINVFYIKPIKKIEFNIKKFLHWWLKNKKIELWTSFNPSVNYILNFFQKTLNTLKNIKDEFLHGKEIKWEIELAKEIQEKLLNKKTIEVPHLNIIAQSKPAREIWWDSYDIIKHKDNYYIYVGDATWHWVWAGFIMTMVNALISWFAKIYEKWNEILSFTNEIIKPRIKSSLLMSLLLVRWNDKKKKLYMTWAGHEYLMIYKNKENKCIKIKSGWVAIWMTTNINNILKEKEIEFEEHDIIVLYSDWITEAINRPRKDWKEEMFGERRLMNAIEGSPNIKLKDYKSAKWIFKNITIELSKFMWYKHTQLDDITLVVIEYKSKDYNILEDFSEDIPEDLITEWNWK